MRKPLLVSKNWPLEKDYIPKDLVEYKEYNGPKIDPNYKTYVSKKVLKAFHKMNKKAQKEGCSFIIDSAYRSYEYQEKIYQKNLEEKKSDLNTVAIPGTSEHQTGLAIDIALKRDGIYTDEFKEDDKEIKWILANAYKYGFILRYPKEKEKITNIAYEYWHFRYVGKRISKIIYKNNLCLEEYIEKVGK